MIYPIEKYRGQIIIYYCPLCGVELGWQNEYNGGDIKSSCPHYEWRSFGNLYYELNASKLNRNAVLRIWSGTTIYILYPRSQ